METMSTDKEPQPLVSIRDISKRFVGVQALDSVSFDVYPGEVVALIGSNGAGKSTLLNILSGMYHPDSGSIVYDGTPVRIHDPSYAKELGISMVYQELNLCPNLSVLQNIYLGNETTKPGARMDWKSMSHEAQALLEELDLHVDMHTPVNKLTISRQQMVEIARTVNRKSRVIIFDEPTSSLTEQESLVLFRVIRELRSRGISILYVSHRLQEVLDVTDRVVALRDGRFVSAVATAETSIEQMVEFMTGKEFGVNRANVAKASEHTHSVRLSVTGLTHRRVFRNLSFEIRRGEILGVTGLPDSGAWALMPCVFGLLPSDAAEISVDGKRVRIDTERDAIAAELAFVPADRRNDGAIINMSLRDNISVASLGRFSRFGIVRFKALLKLCQEVVERFAIKASGPSQRMETLSGGNQQKAIIARWVARKPKVLMLEDPTRGIDVAAKAEVHNIVRELAEEGVAVMVSFSEISELISLCDRAIVMKGGEIVGELSKVELAENNITRLASVGARPPRPPAPMGRKEEQR